MDKKDYNNTCIESKDSGKGKTIIAFYESMGFIDRIGLCGAAYSSAAAGRFYYGVVEGNISAMDSNFSYFKNMKVLDFSVIEKSQERRMNIIAQNGNDALHYEDGEDVELFKKTLSSINDLLNYKNKKYGNAALEPLNIFKGKCKVGDRLDDKLARVKNGESLKKNDIVDLTGYLILTCVEMGWDNFDEFKD